MSYSHSRTVARLRAGVSIACVLFCLAAAVRADLQPDQVLVLYNSQGPDSNGSGQSDSLDIFQYYQLSRPGVLGFDFNDPTMVPGDISYSDYTSMFRDPLRDHLTSSGLASQVVAFTLTRGLPHRIQDINLPVAGDQPSNAGSLLTSGNATYATVDAELTLLWQRLNEGEANGTLDSSADNVVFNPYHNATESVTNFSRSRITRTKVFESLGNAAWEMLDSAGGRKTHAGNIYLTSRLDGNSVDDVFGLVDRGKYPSYNQFQDLILIDESDISAGNLDNLPLFENNNIGHLGDDYDETAQLLGPLYDKLLFNEDSVFYIGSGDGFTGSANIQTVTDDVAVLASYGGNHGGDATGFVESFAGQLSNGAIMNTLESYNAKDFGDVGGFSDQGQLADFVEGGGTFGIGQAWEPFAFSLADNEVLLDNFLFGELTWVEAAWSSVPWLSWQHVVIGDPLSKAKLIVDPQTIVWNGTDPNAGAAGDGQQWSDETNWTRADVADAGFAPGDTVVFSSGSSGQIELGEARIVESIRFSDHYRLSGADLVIRSGAVTVDAESTATLDTNIYSSKQLRKLGDGKLFVSASAPATLVQEGTFGGSGSVAGLTTIGGARVMPGFENAAGVMTVNGDFIQNAAASLVIQLDGTPGTSSLLDIIGTATLDGMVDLVPVNLFAPPQTRGATSQFTILTADEIVGGFASVAYDGISLVTVDGSDDGTLVSHVADGLFHILNQDANAVLLTSYLALPGDANGDMTVDATDLAIWDTNKFSTGTDWVSADFNGDGRTDVSDFNVWNDNRDLFVVGVTAIPEPQTLTLLAWLLPLGFLIHRRRLGR